jgi:3-deoxy-D-manno-octulosonic-acid transferase
MNFSDWLYNLAIHTAVPLVSVGQYLGFSGREPERHASLKFDIPSEDFLSNDIQIWFHCASVGEAGLVNQLLTWTNEMELKQDEILVTTQTLSGLNQIDHEQKTLLPVDYPGLIGPLTRWVDAGTLIVLETELWPNLFRLHPNQLYLFNARISDSTINWYRRLKPLISSALDHCDGILARSDEDYRRFGELASAGVDRESVGNLKWTSILNPPENDLETPFNDEDLMFVVGSTHEGEERFILEALVDLEVNLILGPRHLNRVDDVAQILDEFGYNWVKSSNYSSGEESNSEIDVFLLDEFGLLEASYSLADLAIIGGSWDSTGGHNLLEAAQYGVPVLTGPNLDNFRASADFLSDQGMLTRVEESQELFAVIGEMLGADRTDKNEDLERLHETVRPIRDRYRTALIDCVREST